MDYPRAVPLNDRDLLNRFEAHQSFLTYATLSILRKRRDHFRNMLDQRNKFYPNASYAEAYMEAHHECILAWLNAEIARRIWAKTWPDAQMISGGVHT